MRGEKSVPSPQIQPLRFRPTGAFAHPGVDRDFLPSFPTLNEIKTIETTLQNLTRYAGPHEIIVSDGNSTDGTIELCREYADKVIVYDRPERQTIALAGNMGAAGSHGRLCGTFLDADGDHPGRQRFLRHRARGVQRPPRHWWR